MTDVQQWNDLLDAAERLAAAEVVVEDDVDVDLIDEMPACGALAEMLSLSAYGDTLLEATAVRLHRLHMALALHLCSREVLTTA